jgi:hypothetical protein
MFNRRTVLIIGAGASAEFDMPIGTALMARVAAAVNLGSGGEINDQVLLDRMRDCLGSNRAEKLIQFGPRLAAVASQFVSMDEALHFLSDEPEVVELGKIAISHEIMKAERSSHLYGAVDGNETAATASDDSWVNPFLKMALSASRRQDITRLFENVTVIDFNYDRVLPQYLYWALQRNLEIGADKAGECVRNLKILHPYGSLGQLEWLSGTGALAFGAERGDLAQIASRIRTYTEETSNPEFEQIRGSIEDGRILVVIGFGFHTQNIRIVTPNIAGREGMRVFMTVYGIDQRNHTTVQREMGVAFRCVGVPEIFHDTGSRMLRDLALSIGLAAS